MSRFLELEGAYLVMGIVVLAITLYVTTRPFMSPRALRRGVPIVGIVVALLIAGHYWITTSRIAEVKRAFDEGKPILCESRIFRNAAQSIQIRKGVAGWRIVGDTFVSPSYLRPFHLARCIVK
ncbi:hypothetical protein [Nitratifractor sp.]